MELRRRRRFGVVIFIGVLGLAALTCAWRAKGPAASVPVGILGALLLFYLAKIVRADLRPFRFGIGADGLTLRLSWIDELVPWHEIDTLILDESHLLLVPTPGSDLPGQVAEKSLPDGRTGLVVLNLGLVLESRDEIRAALRRFGGERFAEALVGAAPGVGGHQLTVGLRGYDRRQVDELFGSAGAVLASGGIADRHAVLARIAAADFDIVLRGYDRHQVHDAMREIAAKLADHSADDQPA